MATVTWDGSTDTDYGTAANWDTGSVPTSSDDVIIANVSNDCVLDGSRSVNSFVVQAGGDFNGNAETLTVVGENGSGFAVDIDGDIVGTNTGITITTPTTTSVDFNATAGNVRDLTINHASCVVNSENSCVLSRNLTITAGEFKTNGNVLTVAGNTLVDGTLTGGNSTLTFGTDGVHGSTEGGCLLVNSSGTFTFGSGDVTIFSGFTAKGTEGSPNVTSTGGGDIIIKGRTNNGFMNSHSHQGTNITGDYIIDYDNNGIFDNRGGTTIACGTFIIKHDGRTYEPWSNSGQDLFKIIGNMEIQDGTFDTEYSGQGSQHLTVTGKTLIDGGTLTCNASTINLKSGVNNSLWGLQVASGTFTGGTGTHTIGGIRVSGGTLTFTSGNTTINAGETSSSAGAIYISGSPTVNTSSGTVIIDTSSTLQFLLYNSNLTLHNLTINSGSTTRLWQPTSDGSGTELLTVAGDLTINGTLDTDFNSQDDVNLTVTGGDISVSGTLLLNNSTVVVSDTNSALSISNVGTVTCGNTNLTVNAVSLGQGSFTAPSASGSFIITGEKSGLAFDYDGNGYVHNSGTIQIKTPASTFVDFTPNDAAHVDINNVTIDHASCVAKWTHACTIAGDLLIKQGTMEADDGDEAFTVQGDVTVGDGTGSADTAVLGNAADTAAMTFGSLTINSDGKYIATSGTTTITSMTSTGSGDRSLSLVSGGTFTNNKGTVLFNGGADQRLQMAGTGNLYNLTVNKADNEFVTFGNLTILNNLDVTLAADHTWRPNATSDTLTVHGNTYLTTGRINNGSTQYAGVNNWGNVTINSGEFVLSSGTNNFTGIRNIGGTVSQS